jgi:2-C-methyl-D-erythritol 4-phosphate cytidylyltransferase
MFSAILLMAGKGERMNMEINKILLPLGNKKVYEYSLDVLLKTVDEIICVISKDNEDIIKSLPNNVKYTFGGKTRQESVINGLKLVTNDYVLIHDSARPFITKELIDDIKKELLNNKNVLACSKCKDTIKELNNNKLNTLDRNKLIKAYTPQCGNTNILLDSYNKALKENKEFTDDLSIVEYYHPEIETKLIYASDDLFKITTALDYELAKLLWRKYD